MLVALGVTSLACEPPRPVKSASGELVTEVSYEEKFPLSNDSHETELRGDQLRRAVPLLDKHGVMALSGDFKATGVLDKSTLVVVIHGAGASKRTTLLKNCAEPHVCAFFAEALKSGVVEKLPVVCRDAVACASEK